MKSSKLSCKGSHAVNCTRICLLCLNKPKTFHKIAGVIMRKIEDLFPEFDHTDTRLPTVICNGCRYKICYTLKPVTFPDYSSYPRLNYSDGGDDCECKLCRTVQSRQSVFPQKQKTSKIIKKSEKKCIKCLNPIHRGINHNCDVKNLLDNLLKILDEHWNSKNFQQITSGLIKIMLGDQAKSHNNKIQLSQIKSKALEILVKPKNAQQRSIISIEPSRLL